MAKVKKKKKKGNVICKWGKKKWKVSRKKILSVGELTYEMEYDTEKKKKKKRTVSFSYTVYLETGVKVQKEISSWRKKVGKKKRLYIGPKRFDPKKMRLTKVSTSGINVMRNGVIHYATIQLTFTQA